MAGNETGWFIDVKSLPDDNHGLFQVIMLGMIYGYGLTYAATLISDGSELLLLIPSIAGLVGSVVLPILGAVPDGMIVFFSGMGPDAQNELAVGVGALAGSSVMLLTIPWFLSILGGRVGIGSNGKANYKLKDVPPIYDWTNWHKSGVRVTGDINRGAYLMMITSMSYLIIQIPGLFYEDKTVRQVAIAEKNWALLGFVCCIVLFCAYLWYSYRLSLQSQNKSQILTREEVIKDAIEKGNISLLGVMQSEIEHMLTSNATSTAGTDFKYGAIGAGHAGGENMETRERLSRLIKPFFHRYDDDNSGSLELEELGRVFSDMGERLSSAALKEKFSKFDLDGDGHVDFEEFLTGVYEYVTDSTTRSRLQTTASKDVLLGSDDAVKKDSNGVEGGGGDGNNNGANNDDDEGEEEEEEEEEIPDDIASLPPDQQQKAILRRSVLWMGFGTLLVLVLSDPMCDVLNEIGVRLHINPFYVAFVLAPLASNASEVIASYSYACKRTVTTMTVSLSALEGAAIMNNTFCFSIFTLLVYTQSLAWRYFAETLAIITVEVLIGIFALKSTQTLLDGFIILSVFPLSLVFVAWLEAAGWD